MHAIHLSAADASVLVMLATTLLSMSVIGVVVLCARRNIARRDPHVDALLEELEEQEKRDSSRKSPVDQETQPGKPWERNGDWWKQ